jgi:Mrp family chromosome partitioning ATPase
VRSTFLEGNEPRAIKKQTPECQGVVEFARKRLQFEPDERQTEVLGSVAKRGILNCTRQWGKSTIAAAKAVHRAYMEKGCTVLVASPSERQSAELVRKAAELLARAGIPAKGDGHNDVSLQLPNGSRIIGITGRRCLGGIWWRLRWMTMWRLSGRF